MRVMPLSDAATKFGSRLFRDFNFYSENINLAEQRAYLESVASMYNIQLEPGKSNQSVLEKYDRLYPNSQFYDPRKYRFVRSHQPDVKEIQQEVLENINHAKKSILVVQPYYYPIKSFERAITNGTVSKLFSFGKRGGGAACDQRQTRSAGIQVHQQRTVTEKADQKRSQGVLIAREDPAHKGLHFR